MKKALLVDTNISALPLYNALKKQGMEVYIVGGNRDDTLTKSISTYTSLDYSDLRLLENFIKQQQIDFLVPGCNDLSYKVCSELGHNQFYGLDSPQVNMLLNDKQKFKEYALSKKLPVAQVFTTESDYTYPLIIKPVDTFSGRGVSVVRIKEEVRAACEKALLESRAKRYIAEEYLTGQLYSHSAFIQNQKIVTDFIVIESCNANPYAVDTSYVYEQLPPAVLNKIRAYIEFIATDLEMVDGLLHTQFIYDEEKFWFLEITRRCPGDLYSLLVQKSTGFDYARAYISPFIHEKFIENQPAERRFILRHTITSKEPVHYNFLSYKEPLQIESWIALSKSGDYLYEAPKSRVGIGFYETKNMESLVHLYKKFAERKIYDIV